MTTYLYFGYGSNMNQNILIAKGMQIHRSAPCEVRDYKLVFNLKSNSIVEPGYANVEQHEGGSIHGVCHEMCERDILRMDLLEPSYTRVSIPGVLYDGTQVQVEVYIINAQHNTNARTLETIHPSQRYLRILLEGAREAKLNPTYVSWLASHASTKPPPLAPNETQRKLIEAKVWSYNDLIAHMSTNSDRMFMVLKGIVFDITDLQYPIPYKQTFMNKTRNRALGCATFSFAERYGKGAPKVLVDFSPSMMEYVDAHTMDILMPRRGAVCLGSMDDRAKWDTVCA